MALIRLKYRATFSCTTNKGIFYHRIIYGRNIEDLKAQIKEIEKLKRLKMSDFLNLHPMAILIGDV